MRLKNYQEDVVFRAIEIALEDRHDLLCDEAFVNDVAAYVLNRVPPRYVMSERGFLRLALEHMDDAHQERSLANVIELMMLVNRGVEIVGSRRSADTEQTQLLAGDEGIEVENGIEYVHNYPQIIGRVVDARTDEPISGAVVTLYVDGDRVAPAANGWQNPYVTSEPTRGHFSFWPRSARSDRASLRSEALFTVEHSEYGAFSRREAIVTEAAFDPDHTISGDRILSLDPFRLEPDHDGPAS